MTLKSITTKECSDLCITAGCLEKGSLSFILPEIVIISKSFQVGI